MQEPSPLEYKRRFLIYTRVMHLRSELDTAVARLGDARKRVEELINERDSIIVEMIHHGMSKKSIADLAGVAPVSVYKILSRYKERESLCP